jgi:DHA2 family multidrug resistance protein
MAGALFGIGAITGPLLGPSLGGYLIGATTWHWIFFINLPFGIIATLIAVTAIREPRFVPEIKPVDVTGIALLAIGMGSLQYVLEEGNRAGWGESKRILLIGTVAAISLICFVSHELETEHPAVDLRVFKSVGYAAVTAINFLVGTSLFAGSFMYALYLGVVMRFSAVDTGLVFLKGSWVQILVFPIVGKLVTKMDPRILLVLAQIAIFWSLWLNGHLTADADTATLVTPLLIRGIGIGLGFVTLTLLAVQSLSESQRPGGNALFNLTRELGASVGTAWMTTSLDRSSRSNYANMTRHVDVYSLVASEHLAGIREYLRTKVPGSTELSLGLISKRIMAQAYVSAFNGAFLTLAGAVAIGTILILLVKKPPMAAADAVGAGH